MGQTAIPNPSAPATPVTSCPATEYSMYGGESIAELHPSDAQPVDPDAGRIDVLDNDGALRI